MYWIVVNRYKVNLYLNEIYWNGKTSQLMTNLATVKYSDKSNDDKFSYLQLMSNFMNNVPEKKLS